jgi:rubrerythrin
MEANALDRYIKMGRAVDDDTSRKVFLVLSGEERSHLERLASVLDGIRSRG